MLDLVVNQSCQIWRRLDNVHWSYNNFLFHGGQRNSLKWIWPPDGRVNTAGHRTGTEHSLQVGLRSVCRQGIWCRSDLQQLWSRRWLQGWRDPAGGDGRGVQQERSDRVGHQQRMKTWSWNICTSYCEYRIYFNQTWGDSGKTNLDCVSDFCLANLASWIKSYKVVLLLFLRVVDVHTFFSKVFNSRSFLSFLNITNVQCVITLQRQ